MKILISGGSGLVGKRLTQQLESHGHEVAWLTRAAANKNRKHFLWEPEQGKLDYDAMEWPDAIVNLAGAGVADVRWTETRKQEIEHSRVAATKLLVEELNKRKRPCTLLSASAIGIYGHEGGDKVFNEKSDAGNDFLAIVCKKWEEAAGALYSPHRLVLLRIGIVLSTLGGALPKMMTPARLGLLAPLGTGKQYMSWIHIDDLCSAIHFLVSDTEAVGVYNGCCTLPVTNEAFTMALAKAMQKPAWLPPVPSMVLQLTMGDMAQIVLGGQKVLPQRLVESGFRFTFNDPEIALKHLLAKGI
jgi:hypothetical protein